MRRLYGFLKRHGTECTFALLAMLSAFFFVHVLSLSAVYSAGVGEEAKRRADFYSSGTSRYVRDEEENLLHEAQFFSTKLAAAEGETEVNRIMKELYLAGSREPLFLTVCRFSGGKVISWDGTQMTEYPEIEELLAAEGDTISRVFQYDNRVRAIAASVRCESPYAERVALLYDRSAVALPVKGGNADGVTLSEFTLLCKQDGRILERIENTDTFTVGNEPIRDGVLNRLLTSDTDRASADAVLREGGSGAYSFRYGTDDYVLTLSSFGPQGGYLSLLAVYRVADIYGDGFAMMESIRASLLGLAVMIVVMIVAMFFAHRASRERFYRLEMIDPVIGCATPKKFEEDTSAILRRHKTTNFALVSLRINNFGYVLERFGDTASEELAKYTANIIRGALMLEETFAYEGEGAFLLFLHYRERQAFVGRLNGMYLRLCAFDGIEEGKYKVNTAFSVYEITWDAREPMHSMLEKLKITEESATVQVGSFSACFYEDILGKNHLRKAEIEGRMENALENSEFHLFYQPKYNLRSKTLDGCEILIRWYDPKLGSYRTPDVFLPVFEEDGFITKIDHFVFYRACENIAARVRAGEISYPISVNVSRVTAIQPDFTEYYIRIKKKFGIEDNFVTLEFTESFAFENYDYLSRMVATLHENGFLCSIDDFGTGYSSYNILKTIEMDEIKLDKFFLAKGISDERDETLLRSVIGMIKKLGMKVTQEGVETADDLRRMEMLGCDVIQGYCFAKPMKYVDYCVFVDKNFVKHG